MSLDDIQELGEAIVREAMALGIDADVQEEEHPSEKTLAPLMDAGVRQPI
jgi:hypothetical protein